MEPDGARLFYRTELTGEDIPPKENRHKLNASDLAVIATIDGMLKHEGELQAQFIRLQIQQQRANIAAARIEYPATITNQVNVFGGGDRELEDRRANLIAAIRAELARRGVDQSVIDGDGRRANDLAPPSAAS